MKMRAGLTLFALCGFIAVPTLCKGGIWTDCCEEACSEQEDEGQGCECLICLEVCEAVAIVAGYSSTLDFPIAVIERHDSFTAIAARASSHFTTLGGASLKIPFHDSDRPLRI